jgi:uncharacterized membrane protein YsdA (DUF1294 family)
VGEDTKKAPGEIPAGRTSGLRSGHVFFLGFLLIAPVLALVRLNALGEPLWAAGILLGFSLLAFGVQWIDKRWAETKHWRVSEKMLHLLELLGGWPGAYLGQRIFRHKTSKISYQFVFCLIVLLYEYAAIDYLLGWKIALYVKPLIGL